MRKDEQVGDPAPKGTDRSSSDFDRRGYSFPEFRWLADNDPDFDAARSAFVSRLYLPEGDHELPVKYREMIVGVLLCSRGSPTAEPHFRRAIREGATLREILEAVEVAVVSTGFPTLHHALPSLMNIDKDIRAGRAI